jgi:hypothetical protein
MRKSTTAGPTPASTLIRGICCAATCASEIVTAAGALSVRFDVEVPYQILERCAYISPRGERGLKNLRDGGLHSSFSVQGIYQLKQEAAAEPGTERTSERCR